MKFLKHLNELFNTNNYKWIQKSDIQYIATFNYIEEYYINFDSIGDNAYNVYFYYKDLENNLVFNLINRIDNSSYKILSNVKHCIEDFIKIICNSEKTSMTEILRLMEESEKQGGTGFEKLFRVTKSISDLEKAKILLATPFVKTKKELDTTPKIVEAGNIANSIYKIARDFIF